MNTFTKSQQLYQNKPKKPKTKRCKVKVCRKPFVPSFGFQEWCCDECALLLIEQKKQEKINKIKKQQNKEKKEFRENDRVALKANAQRLINKYARLRDQMENGYRCCTCGITKGKMDGGHFLPTSSYSAIRYNTNQIHQQCIGCNQYRHGMYKEYRVFMVEKYGENYVKNLESTKGTIRSYSTQYLQKLIKILLKKIKRVEKRLLNL